MRRKSMTILNARRVSNMLAPNKVHPESPRAAAAAHPTKTLEQHCVLLKGSSLLYNYAKITEPSDNPYVLLQPEAPDHSPTRKSRRRNLSSVSQFSQDDPFILTARRALANLGKLPWHAAVVGELRAMQPQLSAVSFDDSVLAMVNLVEKCSVSVVFGCSAAPQPGGAPVVESSKVVAQCMLRRAIESPSVAMGHPAVDMFGETGAKRCVAAACTTAAAFSTTTRVFVCVTVLPQV
jgi:hypothetical protein